MEMKIPPDFDFAQLNLSRDLVTNKILYDIPLIAEMLDLKQDEENQSIDESALWNIFFILYKHHLERGGRPIDVMEQLLREISLAEEDFSYELKTRRQ